MNQRILEMYPAFSPAQLSDAASLIKYNRKKGISDDDFLAAVDHLTEAGKEKVRADAAAGRPAVRKKSGQKPDRRYRETMSCPQCRHDAYVQSVCPNCAKGRAGIKKQYICGECNFVFYID